MNLQKNHILLFIAFIIFIGLSAFLSIPIFSKANLFFGAACTGGCIKRESV